jgi:predicted enzyme related to lactoylglutathione lyase
VASGVKNVIYPIKDLELAKSLFSALLGAEPDYDSPYYVGFNVGEQQLGLDPNGHARGFTGSVGYWEVEDINARYQELLAAGAEEHEPVKDVGNGSLIASVKDADGNVLGLLRGRQVLPPLGVVQR